MSCIYGLFDAEGELRYIGKANEPAHRLRGHMRDLRHRHTPLYSWLRKHGEPLMLVLEEDCEDWRQSERQWIFEARVAGAPILNLADGGDEPLCTRAQRQANARKANAAGNGFTSERARECALKTNELLRNDPQRRRLKYLKQELARDVARRGFTPERLAQLWYCAHRAPKLFRSWFERLTDKHLKPLSEAEWVRFHGKVQEMAERG